MLILANAGEAQKIEGIAGFMQSGYLNAPNAKIFNQVFPGNTAGFSNNYWLVGVTAYYRENSNMFIGDLQFGLQKVYSFNNEHAGAVYEAVIGKYGRIINEGKNYWLYPSAGTGASVLSLTSYDRTNGWIENSRTQTLVSPAFDFGMNADFLISKLKWNEKYYLGWIMGIKAGYRFSVRSNNWSNKEAEFYKINEMPSYTNNTFYLTFSFGGGSFDKK